MAVMMDKDDPWGRLSSSWDGGGTTSDIVEWVSLLSGIKKCDKPLSLPGTTPRLNSMFSTSFKCTISHSYGSTGTRYHHTAQYLVGTRYQVPGYWLYCKKYRSYISKGQNQGSAATCWVRGTWYLVPVNKVSKWRYSALFSHIVGALRN
jgi:hypothetical protein